MNDYNQQILNEIVNKQYNEKVTYTCQHCGVSVTRIKRNVMSSIRNNKALTCSHKCAVTLNTRINVTCMYCGKNISKRKSELRKTYFCSSSCSAKYHTKHRTYDYITDEWKQKQSQIMRSIEPTGCLVNPNYEKAKLTRLQNPRFKIRTSICQECKIVFSHKWSKKPRKYCSRECAYKHAYHPNSTKVHKSIYKEYQMDSGAELAFAMLLDKHNIKWIKNTTKWFPYTFENKTRKYYPDFFLPAYDYWIEIKGKKYYKPSDTEKLKAVGSNIEMMFSSKIILPKCCVADVGEFESP